MIKYKPNKKRKLWQQLLFRIFSKERVKLHLKIFIIFIMPADRSRGRRWFYDPLYFNLWL